MIIIFLFRLLSQHLSANILVCGFGFGNRRRSPGVTEKPSVKMVALRVTSKTKSAILEWKKLPEHHCLSNLLLQV